MRHSDNNAEQAGRRRRDWPQPGARVLMSSFVSMMGALAISVPVTPAGWSGVLVPGFRPFGCVAEAEPSNAADTGPGEYGSWRS